ncbi:MAG: hypothetical protein HC806_10615, partial [Anaerolineae bacterium]|nr:hypothetical protein [Anaerolineae bacterium]
RTIRFREDAIARGDVVPEGLLPPDIQGVLTPTGRPSSYERNRVVENAGRIPWLQPSYDPAQGLNFVLPDLLFFYKLWLKHVWDYVIV